MDLDEVHAQDATLTPHPRPSFADVVASTTSTAPLHNAPASPAVMEDQASGSPGAWKQVPRTLRFKKAAVTAQEPVQASPNAGDKRPFNYVDNQPRGQGSSKRTNAPTHGCKTLS